MAWPGVGGRPPRVPHDADHPPPGMRPQGERYVERAAGEDAQRSPVPCDDRRRNFGSAALSGALFEGGAAFVDTGTVVAAFISRLTPSAVAVGGADAIARVGWLLPQLLVANYAYLMEISPDERRPEYSGFMSVLVAPSRLLVAGSLVTVFSFHALFSLAAVSALVRLGVLSRLGRVPATSAPAGPGRGGRR